MKFSQESFWIRRTWLTCMGWTLGIKSEKWLISSWVNEATDQPNDNTNRTHNRPNLIGLQEVIIFVPQKKVLCEKRDWNFTVRIAVQKRLFALLLPRAPFIQQWPSWKEIARAPATTNNKE